MKLAHVHGIVGVGTVRNMGNLLVACVNTVVGHARAVVDGQAVVVHGGIAGFQAACIAALNCVSGCLSC